MERSNFSEELIQRVRLGTDVLDLVSGYVSLKKAGQNWVGLCPFHTEKTPSFTVSPAKQFYHCFGCGIGGDAISFLMKMDGLSFPQSIQLLGERLGIPVISHRSGEERKTDEIRDQLFRIHRDAAEFFHGLLLKDPGAGRAREYLKKRDISDRMIEVFSLGYALPGWNALQHFMTRKGWSADLLEKAGLIIAKDRPGQSGRHYYDRFRDRILFPIYDLQKRVVGFGGRVLDDSLPKYLNSPETAIFSKGNQLYALEKAREAAGKGGCLVVVEGYFDVIAAHQAGFEAVVATLGTALTANHLQRIHRFAGTVKLIFDPDEAGIRAALRTLDMIIPSPVSGEVVLLPKGEDPDSFIKKRGPEVFGKWLEGSTKLLDFAIEQHLSRPDAKTIEGKLRVADGILPLIRKIERPLERGYYLKYLAESLGFEEDELAAEMARIRERNAPARPRTPESQAARLPKEEQMLVHLLMHDPDLAKTVSGRIKEDDFSDGRLREIFTFLTDSSKPWDGDLDRMIQADRTDSRMTSIVTALMMKEPDYEDPRQTLVDCMRSLRLKKMRSEMKALEHQIRAAEKTGDGSQVKSLQGQLIGLKKMTMEATG